MLTHGAEKVTYMKPAGRLYARKYPQAYLHIKSRKVKLIHKRRVTKITKSGNNVKNLELRISRQGFEITKERLKTAYHIDSLDT